MADAVSNSITRLLDFDFGSDVAEQILAASSEAAEAAGRFAIVVTPTSARCRLRAELVHELRAAGFGKAAAEIARMPARNEQLLVVGLNGDREPRHFTIHATHVLAAAATLRARRADVLKNGG